ncbi:MAG TPA: hemolysin family protein [Telluria sp.]
MSDILIILALILLNGIFAMSELALVSAKRLRLEKLAGDGSRGAHVALKLAEEPSNFLSTVQVGITLISIFNGAFGEASLADRLAPELQMVPVVAPYAREVALGIVVLSITFVSIIFGELVPKRIAILYPEQLATWVAPALRSLSVFTKPLVMALSLTTDFIMKLLGMSQAKDEVPTPEEITGMIKEGTEAGVFEKTEYDIVSRALRLDQRRLKALMTPRVDLDLLDADASVALTLERVAASRYSRLPVYRGDRSQIIGVVRARDLFEQAIRAHSVEMIDLQAAMKPALFVPETVSAIDLLELFKKTRHELALIVDEYGDIQGMVTLADVMDALVGDVATVGQTGQTDAVQRDDGSWLVEGSMPLDRLRDLLHTDAGFPDEDTGAYHTVAGLILYQLGYIPKPSEHIEWADFRIEVVDMDGNRIDRLLIARTEQGTPAPNAPPRLPS